MIDRLANISTHNRRSDQGPERCVGTAERRTRARCLVSQRRPRRDLKFSRRGRIRRAALRAYCHSTFVCTAINTWREFALVWRFCYVHNERPFRQSNQVKPCLVNQANATATAATKTAISKETTAS